MLPIHYWDFRWEDGWSEKIQSSFSATARRGRLIQKFVPGTTTVDDELSGNRLPGQPEGKSFVVQNGQDNANQNRPILFEINTRGYDSVIVSYVTRRNADGFTTQELEFSTDNGETYQSITSVTLTTSAQVVTRDLSGIAASSDNDHFLLRITPTGGSAGGHMEISSVLVEGETLPIEDSPLGDYRQALIWRSYRDPSKAPVPVLKSKVKSSVDIISQYRPERIAGPPESVKVHPYKLAFGLISDTERANPGNDTVTASWLASEPILLVDDKPGPDGMFRRLAKPYGVPKAFGSDAYHMPQLIDGGSALITPYAKRRGDGHLYTFTAQALGAGVFQLPRGLPALRSVHVNGSIHIGLIDYDAYHGALYLELEDGISLPSTAEVVVGVVATDTWRLDLKGLPTGEYALTQDAQVLEGQGKVIAVLRKHREVTWDDVRRLSKFDPEYTAHLVDSGQLDGSPIPRGSLWIIETEAEEELVDQAMKHTMPAGTIWRREDPPTP